MFWLLMGPPDAHSHRARARPARRNGSVAFSPPFGALFGTTMQAVGRFLCCLALPLQVQPIAAPCPEPLAMGSEESVFFGCNRSIVVVRMRALLRLPRGRQRIHWSDIHPSMARGDAGHRRGRGVGRRSVRLASAHAAGRPRPLPNGLDHHSELSWPRKSAHSGQARRKYLPAPAAAILSGRDRLKG